MEVHHHAHTSRKKWTHYFWEFLMLFLAVFCGFLAEYQLEHKIEKERLKKFVVQLIKGLEKDTLNQRYVINSFSLREKGFDSLFYFLAIQKDSDEKWLGIHRKLIVLEIPFRYSYRKTAFSQISNSGSLRLFKNLDIVDTLMDYEYTGYMIEKQSDAEALYVNETVTPFINQHFEKNLIFQRLRSYIPKPGWDTTQIGNRLPEGFLKRVANLNPGLENIAITSREKMKLPYLNIVIQKQTAVRLIELLKKEYHLK